MQYPVQKQHEHGLWDVGSPPQSYSNVAVFPVAHFLSACYLCKRQLNHGKDIYMYRFAIIIQLLLQIFEIHIELTIIFHPQDQSHSLFSDYCRGDKAFCSVECRYQQILIDDGMSLQTDFDE